MKGPSAATLYGTDAANGVIRITTRRGTVGSARIRVWIEAGQIEDVNDYPANYTGLAEDGSACYALQVGLGLCEQTEVEAFSPLEAAETSPFTTAGRQQYGVSISGGSERVADLLPVG